MFWEMDFWKKDLVFGMIEKRQYAREARNKLEIPSASANFQPNYFQFSAINWGSKRSKSRFFLWILLLGKKKFRWEARNYEWNPLGFVMLTSDQKYTFF